jgi:hypothetical protein
MIFFLKPFLFSLSIALQTLFYEPNIVITNIVPHPDSFSFTSQLYKTYETKPSHILYIGDKYSLPVTSVSFTQFLNSKLVFKQPIQCNQDSYYKNYLLGNKDYESICSLEYRIAILLESLVQSREKYIIIFDDNFWLEDGSFYRLLHSKNILRILQLDLKNDNLDVYPFFTDKVVYYWTDSFII